MIIKSLNGPVGGSGATTQRPETVDVMFTNVQGASATLGQAVCVVTTAASIDGFSCALPSVTCNRLFYGISLRTVPNNGVGLARAYGIANSVAVFATGTSGTVIAGDPLGPGVAGSLGVNSTGLVYVLGPVLALDQAGAAICSPGGYIRGFVRAL